MPVPEEKTTIPPRFQRAVDKLFAIAPMLDFNRPLRLGRWPSLDCLAGQIATEQKVSRQSVRRWHRRFKKYGFQGLVHSRSDAGVSRYMAKHPEVELRVQAGMARARSAFSIWKSLCFLLGPGAPGYWTVRQYMKGQRQKAAAASSQARRAG